MLAVVALVVVAVTATVGVSPAQAEALTPTLTGTTYTHDHDSDGDGNLDPITAAAPLRKDQGFHLGVDFTLAPPLAVGDTFEVQLPAEIRGVANPSFAMKGPGDVTIGSCAVTSAAIRCELTNPVVATWDTVDTFHVFFSAVARQATTETTLPFEVTGGGTFELPGPPGGIGIGSGTPFPTAPRKSGWVVADQPGQIEWVVWLPATDASSISFTDTLGAGEGQRMVPGSVQVWRTTEWDPQDVWGEHATRYRADEIGVTPIGDQSFTVTFPTRPDAVAYWVQYRSTVPSDVEFGDQFTNRAVGTGIDAGRTVTYNSTAGGTGGGSATTTTTTSTSTTSTPTSSTTGEATTTTTVDGSVSSTTSTDGSTTVVPQTSIPPSGSTTSGAGRSLPRTGSEPTPLAIAGLGLLATGAAVLAARRRRLAAD